MIFRKLLNQKTQKGFTLIELLVVISIISLLSSVVLASLNSARAKARDAVRYSDIQQINLAIKLYIADNGVPPLDKGQYDISDTLPEWNQLATALQPYISELPKDPCGLDCPGAIVGGALAITYAFHPLVCYFSYRIGIKDQPR